MNYLAHLYFGRKTEASLVGNLLGDFVKGNEESLREQFPDAVVDGIRMHRKIDKFTDSHKHFQEGKILLSSQVIRYAGVVIDIFFDHFLAKHWNKYGQGSLKDFIEHAHEVLEKHPEWHSDVLKERLPLLIDNEVLLSYEKKEGIKVALERISHRSKYSKSIVHAYEDFERNYDEFEKIFHDFFPALKNYAATLAPSAALHSESAKLSNDDLIIMWRQHAVIMAEKGFRIESLVGHFKSKGVEEEAATEASQKIIAEIEELRRRQRKLLSFPGYFMLLLSVAMIALGFTLPDFFSESPARNSFAIVLTVCIGFFLIGRSKSVR